MNTHAHTFPDWPFEDAVNTISYCTAQVVRQGVPVLQVVHDWDGDWQFLHSSTEEPGECLLACMGCMVERDPSLRELADLPLGWSASRAQPGAAWQRREEPPEEDGEDADI